MKNAKKDFFEKKAKPLKKMTKIFLKRTMKQSFEKTMKRFFEKTMKRLFEKAMKKAMKMMMINEALKMKPYMKKKMMKMKTCDKTCKANKMIETDDMTKSFDMTVDIRANFAEKLAF